MHRTRRMNRPVHTTLRRATTGIVLLAGLIFSLSVTVSAATTPRQVPSVTGLPSCSSAGLVVWLDTSGSGSAGGSYFDLEFTNVSGHTCTLAGFPGVSAINPAGHQVGSAASRDAVSPLRRITLHSATSATGLPPLGDTVSATAVLKITDVGAYSPAQCDYVTTAGLHVYPPNQTTAKIVPYPFIGCGRRGANFLQVAAVTKGTEAAQ